jgi:hypothetical protein
MMEKYSGHDLIGGSQVYTVENHMVVPSDMLTITRTLESASAADEFLLPCPPLYPPVFNECSGHWNPSLSLEGLSALWSDGNSSTAV